MQNFLKRPYPFLFGERLLRLRVSFFVGIFVFAFLSVFQPFHLNEVVALNVYVCAAIYAVVSAFVSYATLSILIGVFPKFANDSDWNIGREFLMMNAVLLAISISNVFVGMFIELHPQDSFPFWKQVMDDIVHTYAVGIFPVMIITFTNYTVLLKRNLSHAAEHNESLQERSRSKQKEEVEDAQVTIKSATKNNDISFHTNDLIYIMADGNYVECYLDKNGELVREIRRNTLNNVSKQLKTYPHLFRSHRTYLINLLRVTESKGNAQGYQLKLRGADDWIPVSRGNLQSFDEKLNTITK